MSQDFHGNVGQVAGQDVVNREGDTRFEVNIHGDNYGPISLDTPSRKQSYNERPISQYSHAELMQVLKHYKAQWWSGWRGFWLNIPCVLLVVMLFVVAGALVTGHLPVQDPQFTWKILLPTVLLMLTLGYWMSRIRNVEAEVMAESKRVIAAVKLELRKRR